MQKQDIQAIVTMTVRELMRQDMLKDRYSIVIKKVEPMIRGFFDGNGDGRIECFLRQYAKDPYIDVIYLHYQKDMTLEEIAGELAKDTSTVKRNKKRLLMALYAELEE